MLEPFDLDPTLREGLDRFARQCELRRRLRALTRLGLTALALACFGTLALALVGSGWHDLTLALLVVSFIGALWYWLRPLFRPLDDKQIALYIEEQVPGLDNRLLTMVEVAPDSRGKDNSWLIRRFYREAQQHLRGSSLLDPVRPQPRFKPFLPALQPNLAALLLLFVFAELWRPHLILPWSTELRGYSVAPGNARVPLGEDAQVFVTSTMGPRAFRIRFRAGDELWQEQVMRLGETEGLYVTTFPQLQQVVDYRILVGEESSPSYRLTPYLMPEITGLDLVYHEPAYLARPPRSVPNGGDITAIEGTRVELEAAVNKPLSSATIVLASGQRISMSRVDERLWKGSIVLKQNDEYHLEITDRDDANAPYHEAYKITVRKDQAPLVRVRFPYRDLEVSPLDEVSFEFQVDDDFGLAAYGIRYQVADRAPVDLTLSKKLPRGKTSIVDHHRLMLETLDLAPGDLLTWSIWGRDLKPGRSQLEQMGDPFFLEVRPFKRLFRAAVSESGQEGGGENFALAQKEILIATWNLRRDSLKLDDKTYADNRRRITQRQEELRDKVKTGMPASSSDQAPVKALQAAMGDAVSALNAAVQRHTAATPLSRAADAEQRAYRILLQLQPQDSEVGRSREQGEMGEPDLKAGMDELELDKNRNFYEEERVTRAEQEQAAETRDKIKDLAERQKAIDSELAKLIAARDQNATERREQQRRLERLREEAKKNLDQLDRVRRETENSKADSAGGLGDSLDQVREQMSESLDKLKPESLQDARAAASSAVRDLDRLERQLGEQTRETAVERMAGIQQSLESLREQQRRIERRVAELQQTKDSPRLTANDPKQVQKTALMKDKQEHAKDFERLMEDAATLANMAQGDQDQLASRLGDWLRKTSKRGIGEDIEKTTDLARLGAWPELAEREAQLGAKLEQAGKELDKLAGRVGGNELESRQQALEELRDLRASLPKSGSPAEMKDFAAEGYRNALENLRNAEGLLGESRHKAGMGDLRREIERIRRNFKQDGQPPKFDMVKQLVAAPLDQTIAALAREVEALSQKRQFVLTDDSGVPERYRKQVAEYFKVLTETEGN